MEREKPTIKTPEQTEYKTEIQTRDVKVGSNDIKTVSGNEVVNIPGGGTVPTKQLTVAQRVALQNGTLTLKTQVTVTTPIITPGTTITPDTPRTTTNIVAILTLASDEEENGKHFSGEKID